MPDLVPNARDIESNRVQINQGKGEGRALLTGVTACAKALRQQEASCSGVTQGDSGGSRKGEGSSVEWG